MPDVPAQPPLAQNSSRATGQVSPKRPRRETEGAKADANRRIIGIAMLVSAVLMALLAIFFITGVIPFDPESRTIVAAAFGVAAAAEALVGVKFLLSSSS